MTDRMLCRFPVYLLVRMVMDLEAVGKPRAAGVVQPKTWERRTGGVGASKTVRNGKFGRSLPGHFVRRKGQSRNNVIARLRAPFRYPISDAPYGGGHDMAHLTFSAGPQPEG